MLIFFSVKAETLSYSKIFVTNCNLLQPTRYDDFRWCRYYASGDSDCMDDRDNMSDKSSSDAESSEESAD